MAAEQVLWEALRGRRLDGHKFRRQYPVGSHILDFVCIASRLVVELDGAYHALEDQHRYDEERTEHLEQYGYRVIRFSNQSVFSDLDRVLDEIRLQFFNSNAPSSAGAEKPPLSPNPGRERGLGKSEGRDLPDNNAKL